MKQTLDLIIPKPDVTERNIFFCKGVDNESIETVVKAIVQINEEDNQYQRIYDFHGFPYKRNPIKIHLDTYGGFVYQTLGLINIMENSKTPIHTIVTGCAMSAGFMILISGHRRFAHRLSTPLYHQLSGGMWGTAKDMEDDFIESKRMQKMLEDIVARKTKITRKKLKEIYDTKKDWYMTAPEAKKLGVVDEII